MSTFTLQGETYAFGFNLRAPTPEQPAFVKILDAASGRMSAPIDLPGISDKVLLRATFAQDGNLYAVVSDAGKTQVFDLVKGAFVPTSLDYSYDDSCGLLFHGKVEFQGTPFLVSTGIGKPSPFPGYLTLHEAKTFRRISIRLGLRENHPRDIKLVPGREGEILAILYYDFRRIEVISIASVKE